MKRNRIILVALLCAVVVAFAWRHLAEKSIEDMGLQEIANGDAHFWLMQGAPNYRLMPCTVYYQFDTPLNEAMLRDRLDDLISSYTMFKRNIVEVDGLPYWQLVDVDWSVNLRVLDPGEDIESVRKQAELDVSRAVELGQGVPLFRSFLSADRKQLVFVWHHVLSDLEGMFNKHAKRLFKEDGERTQFGYQIDQNNTNPGGNERLLTSAASILDFINVTERQLGFQDTSYEVAKFVLPIKDKALYSLGIAAGLPMSDIFSFIALRSVTRYESLLNKVGANTISIQPMLSPISLRLSSLDMSEGNDRAVRRFPFVFPLESLDEMHKRIVSLEPVSSSYDTAGKLLKLARKASFLEPTIRKMSMPDYISNYFPLADIPLAIGDSKLVTYRLRVPMVPYERTKFAWSNYNGDVLLYLHTDPLMIEKKRMIEAFQQASKEVLEYLVENS